MFIGIPIEQSCAMSFYKNKTLEALVGKSEKRYYDEQRIREALKWMVTFQPNYEETKIETWAYDHFAHVPPAFISRLKRAYEAFNDRFPALFNTKQKILSCGTVDIPSRAYSIPSNPTVADIIESSPGAGANSRFDRGLAAGSPIEDLVTNRYVTIKNGVLTAKPWLNRFLDEFAPMLNIEVSSSALRPEFAVSPSFAKTASVTKGKPTKGKPTKAREIPAGAIVLLVAGGALLWARKGR